MNDGADPIRPEVLLAHAGWLRGLTRALVADSHDADDIAQETWLAALEHPPRGGGSVRGWLHRVARNAAHTMRLRNRRRARREERVERPAGMPDPARVVERVEIARRLAGMIQALDEPYRTTITLRYLEGWETVEIAERSGRPASTVRSHVERGLAKLRCMLDRDHDGNRRAWVIVLAPLAAERQPSPTPVSPPGGAGGARRIGLVAGVGLVVGLAILGLILTSGAIHDPDPDSELSDRTAARGESRGSAAPGRADNDTGEGTGRASESRGADVPGVAPNPLRTSGTLRGCVRSGNDGTPCPDALVRATLRKSDPLTTSSLLGPVSVRTDARGEYRFGAVRPGTYDVTAHPRDLPPARQQPTVTVSPNRAAVLDLVTPPGVAVFGVVTDAATGAPIAGAVVKPWLGDEVFESAATSAADGTYRLVGMLSGHPYFDADDGYKLIVRRAGYAAAAVEYHPDPRGRDLRCDLRLTRAGTIVGKVVSSEGLPVAGATIHFERAEAWVAVSSGADGTFRITALPPGPHELQAGAPGFHGTKSAPIEVEAGRETSDVVLELGRGGEVRGRVLDASGAPLSGVRVQASVRDQGREARTWADTGRDGAYHLTELPPGRCIVSAVAADHVGAERGAFMLAPAERVEAVDFVLEKGRAVAGKVRDAAGEAMVGAKVELTMVKRADGGSGPDPKRTWFVRTDVDGRFRIEGLREGPCWLRASLNRAKASLECRTGDENLVLDCESIPGGAATGRVIAGATRRPVVGVWLCAMNRSRGKIVERLIARDGTFRLQLPPGEWELSAATDTGLVSGGVAVVVSEDRVSTPVDLVLAPGGTVCGRVTGLDGGPPRTGWLEVGTRSDTKWRQALADPSGAFVLAGFPPGLYRIRARGDGLSMSKEIHVVAGQETLVSFAMSSPEALRVVVVDARGDPVAGAQIDVRGPDGRPVLLDTPRNRRWFQIRVKPARPGLTWEEHESSLRRTKEHGRFVFRELKPGQHVVEVHAEGHPPAKVPVVVGGEEMAEARVVLE